jgi:gliding motility-associated-like protein
MRIIKHLILFIILLINVTSFAQKQANIWHFGNGRSLDFSSGAPVNVTGSQIFTYEGCASYCDKYGNFLFYTNGGGEAFGVETGRIWNRNNAVMYDMLGIEGGGISSAQSSVIFEAPGQDSVYYVFTMEDLENQSPNRGLAYFTVDMRLNAGLGAVVLSNVQVHSPSVEGLCAIKHANGQDYWVIIYQDSIGLGVYSVTQTGGVSLAGTFTGAGTTLPIPSGLQVIKASPNGQYLVALFDNINNGEKEPFLLRFNNATGQISLPIRISTTTSLGAITSYEFSPNSKFLYTLQIDTLTPFPIPQSVVKFNIQAPNINSSASVIYNTSISSLLCGLQTGPDGKIYFIDGYGGDSKINRIVCPNTSATVELNLFNYPNSFFNALPNFPAWLFENNDSIYVSLGPDTIRLCDVGGSYVLNAQNPGASYLWSTGATTQSITVNTPGTYSVTVTGDCGTGTDRVVVVNCNTTTSPVNCDTTGNWFLFGNYDGGKLNIIVDQNIPNLKIGICTYEPVIVTFSGPFVGNITDVYYAGTNSSANNNHCGFPITTTSFVGVNPALTTVDVIPPVNIISPPNPANIGNQPNGFNFGIVGVISCDVNTYQGGVNTIDQVVDVFQTRFGGSLRGLKVQYCCWSDTLPYRLSNVSGRCCNTTPGIATLTYPPGPFCGGSGQVLPTLLGDSSGTFFSTPSGLIINTNTGVVNLSGSNPGTYEVFYALTENCITNLFKDTIVISSGSNSVSSISATACSSYTAPWGTVYTQSGIYNDTLTNVSGCDSIISVNLTITGAIIAPTITASACSTYTASWGTVYTQSGTYTDTLASVNGCDSIVSVNLTITGLPTVAASSVSASCGLPNGTATATATGGSGNYSYSWSNGATGNFVTGLASGNYSVTATDQNGCASSPTQVTVLNGTPSGVSIAANDTCLENRIPFSITTSATVSSVNWNFDDPSSGANNTSTSLTPTHLFSATGTYNIRAIVNLSCDVDTIFKTLSIKKCDSAVANCQLFVPSAFTPNNDGKNDKFNPQTICPTEQFECLIYSRWGELIFRTTSQFNQWDGKYKGEDCSTGVYVYLIRYKFSRQQPKNVNGTITLLR